MKKGDKESKDIDDALAHINNIVKKVEEDKEIKKQLSERGYDGLFETTQDYLNEAMMIGENKKPVGITVIIETEESTFVSQKINRLKARKHSKEHLIDAIDRTEAEHEGGEAKKEMESKEIDDALAHINGMCHLSLELNELVESEKDKDGKISASEISTMTSAIIMTEVQKTLPKEKFKSMLSEALERLFDGKE